MWLIVGLGNPGSKYTLTRHNVGFLCIDHWLKSLGSTSEKTQHKALISKVSYNSKTLMTAKPQTFMNLSGDSVQAIMHFFKIPLDKLIVVHDEIDLPYGQMKLQRDRGHGGNNGVRDIHAKLSSKNYIRLRIGVGRSENAHIGPGDYVLQNFSNDQMTNLGDVLNVAGDALCDIVDKGFEQAATLLNSKGK